jgi:hypothetical protein
VTVHTLLCQCCRSERVLAPHGALCRGEFSTMAPQQGD